MTNERAEWHCPTCNASNDPDFTHCRICGVVNPNLKDQPTKKCTSCGHLAGKETCCPVCGSDYFLNL